MSYIENFKLSGYKSIKNVSGDFKKGLNILIGNNGSGKSNLLEFIFKIFRRNYSGLDVFHSYFKACYNGEMIGWPVEGIVDNSLDVKSKGIKIKEPQRDLSFSIEFIKFGSVPITPVITTEYHPKYDAKERRFLFLDDESDIKLPFSLFIGLRIDFNKNFLRNLPSLNEVNEEQVIEALQVFFTESYSQLRHKLFQYTPIEDVRFSNSIRLTKIDSSIVEFRNIVFEYKINNEWLGWDALSDGTKRLIYIIFVAEDLDLDESSRKFTTQEFSAPILFIEEPELGIHPHQLHLLMNYLKEKSKDQQIIISTHSPQVLDVLSSDELDRIKITEIDFEKGTSIRELTETETKKAQKYLRDEGLLSDYWRFSDFQRSKQSK